ncbi:MAG TPA: hypothetical protein VFF26_11270 [Gallionella sp.]|nr:hypothetical protein [Gallionella sp.]
MNIAITAPKLPINRVPIFILPNILSPFKLPRLDRQTERAGNPDFQGSQFL